MDKNAVNFEKEIRELINRYSIENNSNTPDWILAQYILSCLAAFETAIQQRETCQGRDGRPIALKKFSQIINKNFNIGLNKKPKKSEMMTLVKY